MNSVGLLSTWLVVSMRCASESPWFCSYACWTVKKADASAAQAAPPVFSKNRLDSTRLSSTSRESAPAASASPSGSGLNEMHQGSSTGVVPRRIVMPPCAHTSDSSHLCAMSTRWGAHGPQTTPDNSGGAKMLDVAPACCIWHRGSQDGGRETCRRQLGLLLAGGYRRWFQRWRHQRTGALAVSTSPLAATTRNGSGQRQRAAQSHSPSSTGRRCAR